MNSIRKIDRVIRAIDSQCVFEIAFRKECFDKMLLDGYVDMNTFIQASTNKVYYFDTLQDINSSLAYLFNRPYPKDYESFSGMLEIIASILPINGNEDISSIEAKALVFWIYKQLEKKEERILFTLELLHNEKMANDFSGQINHYKGVFYFEKTIMLEVISSTNDFLRVIKKYELKENGAFFRGHSEANYLLRPSIMRNKKWLGNEKNMYNELLIECPDSFMHCKTHFEFLVKMQHYGLPTRLLDITKNPLVALYFAACSKPHKFGEVITINADKSKIRFPKSDIATILSCLPLFSAEEQSKIKMELQKAPDDKSFNKKIPRLIHEIKLEKPAFSPQIVRSDLIDSFIVLALKNNVRIIKQDGAFILSGLINENDCLDKFRYKINGKKILLLVDNKADILKELDSVSINHATLFPDIENISGHIRDKYSGLNIR